MQMVTLHPLSRSRQKWRPVLCSTHCLLIILVQDLDPGNVAVQGEQIFPLPNVLFTARSHQVDIPD